MQPWIGRLAAPIIVVLGLIPRIVEAARTYLNPDEIQYFFLAVPGNLKDLILSGRQTDHPPLLFFLLHPFVLFTSSELLLRLVPVLAGALFPWVVYKWLARSWSLAAGLIAMTILTFTPDLIELSAQVRGYMPLLLFAATSLLLLEIAMDDDSLPAMFWSSVALVLAILTEYSAAWFAGGAAAYFVVRALERRPSPRLIAAWAGGQIVAIATCGALYRILIRPRLIARAGLIDDFLKSGFPSANQSPIVFALLNTVRQFSFAFSSKVLGAIAALLFAAGLACIFRRRSSFAVLLVTPFLLACGAALLHLHPYGRSRHTVILSIFAAAGVAIALDQLLRIRASAGMLVCFSLLLLWPFVAEHDQLNIEPFRNRRASMLAAVDYVRSAIPPGSIVLTSVQSSRYLRFYLLPRPELLQQNRFDWMGPPVQSLNLVWNGWSLGDSDAFAGTLGWVRDRYHLPAGQPVWVVDGGMDMGVELYLRDRYPGISFPSYRDFDRAVTVFQTPPGL